MGYIYILTNPSFPEYVKIGYADDVKNRLAQLNRSECTPFAFRVYATYEVSTRLTDMKLHRVIDQLNPDLRSVDTVNGKKRVREFYAMSKEDAYSLFEAIAEINGLKKNLRLWQQSDEERKQESDAKEIEEESKERLSPFAFSKCNIAIGEEIEYSCIDSPHNGEKCTVVDDRHVEYHGETWSLSGLAKQFSNRRGELAGPRYFKYKGEWLNDIRRRLGV